MRAALALARSHGVVVTLVLLLGLLLAAWYLVRSRPEVRALPPPAASATLTASAPAAPTAGRSPGLAAPGAPAAPATSSAPSVGLAPRLTVHVAGKVRRPGVVTLPAGSRVVDAVRAAGGVLPGVDLASLNLAAPLSDGEQVAVGVTPAADARPGAESAAGGGRGPGTTPVPVDLNTATVEQLDSLPGVGPVLAGRIVDFREANGGFRSVAELRQVTGIGDRKYADLAPLVRAGP